MRVYREGGGEHWTIMDTTTSSYLVSVRPGCLERVQLPPCMEQDASGFCSFLSLCSFIPLFMCVHLHVHNCRCGCQKSTPGIFSQNAVSPVL